MHPNTNRCFCTKIVVFCEHVLDVVCSKPKSKVEACWTALIWYIIAHNNSDLIDGGGGGSLLYFLPFLTLSFNLKDREQQENRKVEFFSR